MYEMQHFVHNFPPACEQGFTEETSSFSVIYAGKIAFFTFGHFVGSNFEKNEEPGKSPFYVRNAAFRT